MPQHATPAQLHTETPLLTKAELRKWLKVSDFWIRLRLNEPAFVERCVVDIATEGSKVRKLRFPASAVADYLNIPADATPKAA